MTPEHLRLGKWGEETACEYLITNGYNILETNWRNGHLEVDIVAKKLGFLIFIEVKTRTDDSFMLPEESVNQDKIQNLLSAADAFARFYNLDMPIQFDIITIIGNEQSYELKHIKNAFDKYNWDTSHEFQGRYWKHTTFIEPDNKTR